MEKYFKRVEDSDDDDEDVLIHRPDVTEDAQPDDVSLFRQIVKMSQLKTFFPKLKCSNTPED